MRVGLSAGEGPSREESWTPVAACIDGTLPEVSGTARWRWRTGSAAEVWGTVPS